MHVTCMYSLVPNRNRKCLKSDVENMLKYGKIVMMNLKDALIGICGNY